MKISTRLGCIIGCCVLGALVLALLALQTIHSSMLGVRQAQIKLIVSLASKEAEIFLAQEKAGTLTRYEAQAKAKEAISALRSGDDYVFVRDLEGMTLVHPDPRKEGVMDPGNRGTDGRTTLQVYLDALKTTDIALVGIMTKRPNGNTDVLKINGLSKITEWGWIIGFGQFADDIDQAYWDNVLRFILIGVVIFSIIITIAVIMSRRINRSLSSIQKAVSHIEGDLDFTIRAEVTGRDEIAEVSTALNRLLDKLRNRLSLIAESTHKITDSSAQMATAAAQVAIASEQQSDSASCMVASIEEMTASINHASDRSTEAHALSQESGNLADSSVEVIGQTVSDINTIANSVNHVSTCLQELESHSNRISRIVSVITEVTEQTNLLALNAAIEAARAGEQGRGFAVVADEVRKLAERTVVSTKEIASMIDSIRNVSTNAVERMEQTMNLVETGVHRAGNASLVIQEIGGHNVRAMTMVDEITTAIREQSEASKSIAGNVEKIAEMAEESSAAAQNSAISARDLAQLAKNMNGIINNFRL